MIRASHLVWGALIMTVGTGLFLVANEVGAREKELARLYADIRRTTESLHVLRAEWSYLNDPSRLERLASTHLGLEPVRPEQYVSVNQLPLPPAETGEGLPASLPGKGGATRGAPPAKSLTAHATTPTPRGKPAARSVPEYPKPDFDAMTGTRPTLARLGAPR